MSSTAIKVENLGKKYIIRHKKQEPYKTFQDPQCKGGNALSYGDISTLSFQTTKLFHTIDSGAKKKFQTKKATQYV